MDYDEIVDVALGNNGEMRNFKGYNVFRVEQNDAALLKELVDFVKQTENIQSYVKKGFFDPILVEQVFKDVNPEDKVKDKQTMQWIESLNKRFEENVGKLDVEPHEIIE